MSIDTFSSIAPGDWQVARRLWTGALCAVDEVRSKTLGMAAALKHLHYEHLGDPGLVGRCLNEALIIRRLQRTESGPRGPVAPLPKLYDHGLLDSGCPFLLLELLGESLASRMNGASWPQPGFPECSLAAARLGLALGQSLQALHRQGIVHRDLRPENILLSPDGKVAYLIDFGLAKASDPEELLPISTGDDDFLGTDEYMAPEQWESAKWVTGAADVYALGVLLYQLVCGRLPFLATERRVLMYQHLVDEPSALPSSVPPALAQLIRACLAKRPSQRPAADDLVAQLQKISGA